MMEEPCELDREDGQWWYESDAWRGGTIHSLKASYRKDTGIETTLCDRCLLRALK